jgi:uncharacterized protein (TIGR00661 family)
MNTLLENDKKYTILVAPLDWGLGHATRCIPIIRALLIEGHNVIIGAEGNQAALLKEAFPELTLLDLLGYKVQYSQNPKLLAFKILAQLPKILRAISFEQQWLKQMIKEYQIDMVIADNRYGLYSSQIPSVFITHQLTIKAPFKWLEQLMRSINYSYINRFSACWVPDMEAEINIGGALSHPTQLPKTPVHYINLLSRFKLIETDKKFDCCILLSGPEPQRTVFEKLIIDSINKMKGSFLLVRGKPLEKSIPFIANHIQVYNHLNGEELSLAIQQSECIVCRSGYSTLMELLAFKKKMILIPTPGQTEQEYLADKLSKDGLALASNQQNLDLPLLIKKAKSFEYNFTNTKLFDEINMNELLKSLFS